MSTVYTNVMLFTCIARGGLEDLLSSQLKLSSQLSYKLRYNDNCTTRNVLLQIMSQDNEPKEEETKQKALSQMIRFEVNSLCTAHVFI